MGIAVLTMAAGVLGISAAYAAGRAGSASSGWVAAYWLGEAIVFAPLVWRLASRPALGRHEAAGLVLALATATYLVKVCYSPAAFGFPDELEHWRTTATLLSTHHLFGVNYLLPVSAVYPGLEVVTGAVAAITGMPVFVAGLIVAGLAHLLFTAALFVMFRLMGGSPRVAATACTIYAANPHYQVFDAIYGYQTLALAFFGLALVAVLTRWWPLAAILTAATVVTHHITSYLLAGSLLLIASVGAVSRLVLRRWPGYTSGLIAALALGCAGFIVLWVAFVATSTGSYLAAPLHSFADGLSGIFTAHPAGSGATTPQGPPADRLAGYAATGLIMFGLPFGWWQIRHTQRHRTWAVAFGIGSVVYYVLAVLRITTPDGAEIAGRGMTFVFIPVAYTLAIALAGPGRALLCRFSRVNVTTTRIESHGCDIHAIGLARWLGEFRWRRGATVLAVGGIAAVLLAGGIASGWPPYWERLPGNYVVDGFESGITAEGIAAADWTRDNLGPGNRIAADFTDYLLLGSYGDQNPVGILDTLYCDPVWTEADALLARKQNISYLLVDLRMSERPSVTGGYFSESSPACHSPIPRQDLTKFDTTPGFDRIYDNGDIVIYALAGAQYAP
jgi:hypothetical protein